MAPCPAAEAGQQVFPVCSTAGSLSPRHTDGPVPGSGPGGSRYPSPVQTSLVCINSRIPLPAVPHRWPSARKRTRGQQVSLACSDFPRLHKQPDSSPRPAPMAQCPAADPGAAGIPRLFRRGPVATTTRTRLVGCSSIQQPFNSQSPLPCRTDGPVPGSRLGAAGLLSLFDVPLVSARNQI